MSGGELCGRGCGEREDRESGRVSPTRHEVQTQICVFAAAWRKLQLHQQARLFSNQLYCLNIYK